MKDVFSCSNNDNLCSMLLLVTQSSSNSITESNCCIEVEFGESDKLMLC